MSIAASTLPTRQRRQRRRRRGRLRGLPRVRVLGGAAVAVAVAAAGVFAVQYRAARVELRQQRAALAEAEDELAGLDATLDQTRSDIDQAERNSVLAQANIDAAVADRARIETEAQARFDLAAGVDAARIQTDEARQQVAANAAQTGDCFDGVARAVHANRSGQGQAAVEALRQSSGACTRTLALATGARFPYDFADPSVVRAGGTYYGYSTNAGAGDIQVIRSQDLVNWELVGNGLAGLPAWANDNATWAPSVFAHDGHYIVFYTVRERASGLQCISRAVSGSPGGPFVDLSRGPLVCQHQDGGSIDASPFVDASGRAFLLWKSEGRGARPATLWSRELTRDGLGLKGPTKPLVSADRSFERGVVEAPTMLQANGAYFLFYAAANWSSAQYTTAYAVCAGPMGPCLKPADGRVLRSGAKLAGPGGVEVFRDASGQTWVAFHAYSEPNVGYPSSRYLHLARLSITNRTPSIDTTT